jgi:DNA helicase HerA-like ATPase
VKAPIDQAFLKHSRVLEGVLADFDIKLLVRQIQEECVLASAGSANSPDYARWGVYNEADKSECTSLLGRIEDICSSAELSCLFRPAGKPSLIEEMDQFLDDPTQRIFRISLKYLSFAYSAREIVADAIGRHLLAMARAQKFRRRPAVIFVDEAHQFLSKSLGDEHTRYPLEAFDLLAKEGRKYALSVCIATQRPSDIPEGVLSQIGTLLVHRLTNERDREVVEQASDEIDRSAAEFLPALAPGQAVLIGVDFPVPLMLQISPPDALPDSQGPRFQDHWAQPSVGHRPA